MLTLLGTASDSRDVYTAERITHSGHVILILLRVALTQCHVMLTLLPGAQFWGYVMLILMTAAQPVSRDADTTEKGTVWGYVMMILLTAA
jgi:hypothetical protein